MAVAMNLATESDSSNPPSAPESLKPSSTIDLRNISGVNEATTLPSVSLPLTLLDALPSNDPFDNPSFDAVTYINTRFPTEKSLQNIDSFIKKLQLDISNLDVDILQTVRLQAIQKRQAQHDILAVNTATQQLHSRLSSMRTKAFESEKLVHEICEDIKTLNNVKTNLTVTITALKLMIMFSTALDQLRDAAKNRNYKNVADLVEATKALIKKFDDYRDVEKVINLLKERERITKEVCNQVREDFESFQSEYETYGALTSDKVTRNVGDTSNLNDSGVTTLSNISEACLVVDSIGEDFRKEIITEFCLRFLEGYKKVFNPGGEAGTLDSAERRFPWIKKNIKEFEAKWGKAFPENWNVACCIAEHFCHISRQHLVELLSNYSASADPQMLVNLLRKSVEFENDMANKYINFRSIAERGGNEHFPRFKGIISECFEAYLGPWVQGEETKLMETLNNLCENDRVVDQKVGEDEISDSIYNRKNKITDAAKIRGKSEKDNTRNDLYDDTTPTLIYLSAAELFSAFKVRTERTALISTRQTLFEICCVFKRIFRRYVDNLNNRLPKKGFFFLNEENSRFSSTILGTAEYCSTMLPQLKDAILKVIEESLSDSINFDAEDEMLWNLKSKIIEVVISSFENCLEPSWQKMMKVHSNNAISASFPLVNASFSGALSGENERNDIGKDELGRGYAMSSYISELSDVLSTNLCFFNVSLSPSYYRFLCDKLVQSIIPRFRRNIFNMKKVSEFTGFQLYHDALHLKNILTEVPKFGRKLPSGYIEFVTKEMSRIIVITKVLMSCEDVSFDTFKTWREEFSIVSSNSENLEDELLKISMLKENDINGSKVSTIGGAMIGGGVGAVGKELQAIGNLGEQGIRNFFGRLGKGIATKTFDKEIPLSGSSSSHNFT